MPDTLVPAPGLARGAALLAALALPLAPIAARAAAPGEPIAAARLEVPLDLDGRLEEPAWDRAAPFDGFVQLFPAQGAAPTERTEVRVLFDDRALYVGVHAFDTRPAEVFRPLGRRDTPPFSDQVVVLIDSMRDGRGAYLFTLTAAGVQADALLAEDDQIDPDWDAIWEGAAAATADGWSAELVIPLAVLRFPDRADPRFGFAVKRTLARLHEDSATVLLPRSAKGQASRLGTLTGLAGIHPVRDVVLTPYAAARVLGRPRFDDTTRPRPRLVEPLGDLGLDLRTSLGPGLALQGTLNPDFGQVEADQLIQNLSSFEILFPEKRPFFTQGMDLFKPVAPVYQQAPPHQLFYSRRIGLDAPILGAAKLTGSVGESLQIGVLEAVVTGAGAGAPAGATPGGLRYHAAQPLRFAPRSAYPTLAPATRSVAAAVARWRPDPTRTFGLTATSTVLGGPRCTAAEDALDDDHRPLRCDTLAGNAVAADWSLRTRDGEWFFRGQLDGSQALGGSPARTLADGTVIRRGDLGLGGYTSLGRQGGEPWRFELSYEVQSPRLDLNAAGFQRTQNEQVVRGIVRYVRPTGGGPFHAWATGLMAEARRTTDGSGLDRGRRLFWTTEFQLRSFHWLGTEAWFQPDSWDVREIDQAGIALRRQGYAGADVWVQSDPSRPLIVEGAVLGGANLRSGPLPALPFAALQGKLTLRPHARLETRLDLQVDRSTWRARWVDDLPGASAAEPRVYVFADLVAPAVSATLRQQVVLTPRLTLQAYGQLFTTYGSYGRRYEAAARPGGRVRIADLRPASAATLGSADLENPDFRDGVLNVNVVLRWEYRLGSTLFLVYTRSQAELGYPDPVHDSPSPALTLRPVHMGRGPTTDTFLVKWSYFWRR